MSELDFRDYDIRVYDNNAVFIYASNYIEYSNSYYEWGKYLEEEYLKINTSDEDTRKKVMNLCDSIAAQLIELNDILNNIDEESGE